MKIAFVVNNYPPKTGGVETHVFSLAHHLRRLGHEVLVITLAETARTSIEDGIEVVRLREHLRVGDVLGFPGFGATRRITALLRERAVDAVSVHTRFFPMTWIGVRAGHRIGAAVVHTEHGSDYVVSSSPMISFASRMVDKTLGRDALRRADEVLGVSEAVTDFVRRLSGRSARVFYNAIDPSGDTAPRKSTPRSDRLVFVGRLVEGKGADVFVDVIAATGLTGVILGDGPERAALEVRIAGAGLAERIDVRGRVAPDEVRRALRGAILINPTTLAEGFQTTLLEALDVGGRIGTYDVPGAALLREQGYPVEITESTPGGLLNAVNRLRKLEGDPPRLRGWYWDDRAIEYVGILTESVRQATGRSER